MRNTLDGIKFREMILGGLNNLINNESAINAMNVFPVADGDTGTNMRLTLQHGYESAKQNTHLGLYLKELSAGMLLGARGNSGVILSQLFKGFYNDLARDSIANPREIKNALIRAYYTAYRAVANPVEGTILTVARLGIENIKSQISNSVPISSLFNMYINEMKKVQKETPEMLSVLKEAGVLDSGAQGYITILEGMYKVLIGQKIEAKEKVEISQNNGQNNAFFDENSDFVEGYCMEFLLQLMNKKRYKKTFNLSAFTETLQQLGNSLVAIQEGTIVKIHIHTLRPSDVMILARQYGEFITFKLENMQIQKNQYLSEKANRKKLTHKPLAIIAVVDGEGVEKLYKDMGVDIVIQGGPTMNTSSKEFVDELNIVDADDIIILPNNVNIIEAARQAVAVSELQNVTIIPTKTVLEGYYGLAMDLPDSPNEERIAAITDGTKGIISISIGSAIKNYDSANFSCKVGDKIATVNDNMVAASDTAIKAFDKALESIEDIEDKAALIVLKGESAPIHIDSELENLVAEKYPHLEIQSFDGDEHVYDVIIGVI